MRVLQCVRLSKNHRQSYNTSSFRTQSRLTESPNPKTSPSMWTGSQEFFAAQDRVYKVLQWASRFYCWGQSPLCHSCKQIDGPRCPQFSAIVAVGQLDVFNTVTVGPQYNRTSPALSSNVRCNSLELYASFRIQTWPSWTRKLLRGEHLNSLPLILLQTRN